MTRLDNNQMTWSVDSSKRSEKHEPEVNLDPDLSSSDSSDSSSSESAPKKKKCKNKKKRRKHGKMTRQTHPRVMTLIHLRTVIIGVNDAKIWTIEKSIWSYYAQLTAKFLTTAYKSKFIGFKLDEDPLQRQIYFLAQILL